MGGVLIFLGLICLIVFIIPFALKDEKEAFILYLWISLSLLIYIWGQDFYWTYTHPMKDPGVGAAIGYGIGLLFSISILVPMAIVILWKNLFIPVFKGFIIPFIIILIPIYILFQGYLLLSAYNAYDAAKQVQAKGISKQNMFDFYSPTIKHIQIQAGNPTRDYRWSYRRNRYVFEVNQRDILEQNETNTNLSFWYMPDSQYSKDYNFSIPKSYIAKDSYNVLNQIIIPSKIPLSLYFNFDQRYIDIRADNSKSLGISINKKLGNQYRLKKGIDDGYYYDDNRKKYGNDYLTYYNDTVSIQCHYLENDMTSNICHMSMLSNGFNYKFDIYKKHIPQWEKLYTELSTLFESFIVDVKQYSENLNPHFKGNS